jgi:hypothetical protein
LKKWKNFCAKLNSQWPVTEAGQIQSSNNNDKVSTGTKQANKQTNKNDLIS